MANLVEDQDIESVLPQFIISDSEDELDKGCYYSIKSVNPNRKSEYTVKKWHTKIVFKTVSHLSMKFVELAPYKELRVGYVV